MNSLKNIGLLFLFTALLFTSCRKDEEEFGKLPSVPSTPAVIVNGTFSGVVTDENNQAVENTLISFGANTMMTDENGYFSFKNVPIDTKGSLVTAEKEGYFYNAKFVHSKLNKKNFIAIKMIAKTLTGTFSTSVGGTVTTDDDASIQFAANAIKQESGGGYSGNVNVYATWLDPTAVDLAQRMPGDLRATNSEDEQQQLISYGMIGVELEGDGGQALNIAEGQTATIELPVPATLMANAPATIPLWHMDEATGYWVEDGEATLQGNKYVGTVSHFSFWNVDIPNDYVFIEGTIVDGEGQPLENIEVIISDETSGMAGYGWTDQDGVYAGLVPANQELTISVKNACGEEIYSAVIGPFSEDAIIPTFSIPTTEPFVTLSGTLVDCDNNPITNGYLRVSFGGLVTIIPAEANGEFNATLSVCSENTIYVTGFDLDNLKQSTTVTEIIDTSSLDLANVFVCDDLTEVMNFNVGSMSGVDTDPKALLSQVNGIEILRITGINRVPAVSTPTVFMTVHDPDSGVYIPELMDAVYFDDTLQTTINNNCDDVICDATVEFTTYEGVGGFVIGSFSGTLDPDPFLGIGETQEVSGTFKILIEE